MKKRNWTSLCFGLLFLLGACILMYPTVRNLYSVWTAKQEIRQYQAEVTSAAEDYQAQWQAVEDYNRRLSEKENQMVMTAAEYEEYESLLNVTGIGMMGYIDIPKIQVHLPVYHGIEESALQAGAGHWPGTSLPAGGAGTHCILTAHTGLVKAKMFTDLDQIKEGDTFSLSILDRSLNYQVDQIEITEPDDQEHLLIVDGEDYVTLYTCYPYGKNTHRLLVRGRRVEAPGGETEAADTKDVDAKAADGRKFGHRTYVIFAVAVILLTGLLFWAFWGRRGKRKKEGNSQ